METKDPKEEYRELMANMRQYATVGFGQLTVLIAATGGLLTLLLGEANPLPPGSATSLKILGAVTSFFFWIVQERISDYWHHFRKRAEELENILDYRIYTGRPKGWLPLVTGTIALRVFNAAILVFWILALIFPEYLKMNQASKL